MMDVPTPGSPQKVLESGRVAISFINGKQSTYANVTNLSLSRDWAFFKFTDGCRAQVPVIAIREMCSDSTVFVRSIKAED